MIAAPSVATPVAVRLDAPEELIIVLPLDIVRLEIVNEERKSKIALPEMIKPAVVAPRPELLGTIKVPSLIVVPAV